MRLWPFSLSLNGDIGLGIEQWIRDQFGNVHMWLLIRRSKRVDRWIERSRASGDAKRNRKSIR